MTGPNQADYRDTELDLVLLSLPPKFMTNWHVITGASSSGKTTVIELLAGQGYPTLPEAGRAYIQGKISEGLTITEIRQDRAALTRQIYDLWLEKVVALSVDAFCFLDRGLPDTLAFCRFAGMDPKNILPDCLRFRLATVFMLDRLPYQRDGIRGGDDDSAAYFESWMARC